VNLVEDHQNGQDWSTRSLRDWTWFSLGQRQLWGRPKSNPSQHPWEGQQEEDARLFTAWHSNRIIDNRQKLKRKGFE